MYAAIYGHHAIVEQLVAARADVNTKNRNGCAHSPRPVRRPCLSPTVLVAPAPSGRSTALHIAARKCCTKSAVALLVGGADETITDVHG
jgi:hypothetical protein